MANQAEKEQLQKYFDLTTVAQTAFTTEKYQNDQGKIVQANNGPYTLPFLWSGQLVDKITFDTWVMNSNASLAIKAQALKDAQANYEAYKATLAQEDQKAIADAELAFKLAHPEVAIAQAKADAEVDIAKNKATAIQGTTKYLIIGASILIVVAIVVWYFYRKYKKG